MKATIYVSAEVEIDTGNTDAVDRVNDDWRASYYDLRDQDAVLHHLAYNAVLNGVESAHSRVERVPVHLATPDHGDAVLVVHLRTGPRRCRGGVP